MKLGAQLFTTRAFCKDIDGVRETLSKVAGIGYETVQISGFGPVDPAEVAEAVENSGLEVAATHIKWDRFLNDLDAVIDEHKMWNCSHAAIGGLPGEYHTAEGQDRFLDELGPVAEKLAGAGMDFSYHNHNWEFIRVDGQTWLERLYAKASPEVLKAELDVYWVTAGGGSPVRYVRQCAGREPLVHFKDMVMVQGADGLETRMAEIGEGNLDWSGIIAACRESGVEHVLVEQDRCYDRDPFESLAISFRNLKEMGL